MPDERSYYLKLVNFDIFEQGLRIYLREPFIREHKTYLLSDILL